MRKAAPIEGGEQRARARGNERRQRFGAFGLEFRGQLEGKWWVESVSLYTATPPPVASEEREKGEKRETGGLTDSRLSVIVKLLLYEL